MNSLQYIIDRLARQQLDPNDITSLSELETRDGFEIVEEEELDRLLEFSRQHPALKAIFPFLTDGNSNYICIYTDGPSKGLICAWDHEEPDLSPRFSTITNLVRAINSNPESWDIEELPEDAFDYPSRQQ